MKYELFVILEKKVPRNLSWKVSYLKSILNIYGIKYFENSLKPIFILYPICIYYNIIVSSKLKIDLEENNYRKCWYTKEHFNIFEWNSKLDYVLLYALKKNQ